MERRDFLAASGTAIAAAAVTRPGHAQSHAQPQADVMFNATEKSGMKYRTLGHTGERVSMVGVGGFHLSRPDADEATRIVHAAIDHGVTFFDNSWDYAGGESEKRLGNALQGGLRDKIFLMTKIDGRTAEAAMRQLDESLRRLKTDHLDLLQHHEVIRMDDAEKIFAPNGAMEAVVKAREQGKLRYIGFTGHKSPMIHKHMLDTAAQHGFLFDSVQMPLNVMDAHYNSFEKIVLPMLLEKNIGVLGMKPMGDPFILESKAVAPMDLLHYTMSLPTSVTITGIDKMEILEQALQAVRTFQPFTPEQRAAILVQSEQASRDGKFERYKVSNHFDSTIKHPEYLT